MPFVQVSPVHFPPTHIALAQSALMPQLVPTGQPGQLPPQSTPVSLPFRMRSVQLGPGTSIPVGRSAGTSTATSCFTSCLTSCFTSARPPSVSMSLLPPPHPNDATTNAKDSASDPTDPTLDDDSMQTSRTTTATRN